MLQCATLPDKAKHHLDRRFSNLAVSLLVQHPLLVTAVAIETGTVFLNIAEFTGLTDNWLKSTR